MPKTGNNWDQSAAGYPAGLTQYRDKSKTIRFPQISDFCRSEYDGFCENEFFFADGEILTAKTIGVPSTLRCTCSNVEESGPCRHVWVASALIVSIGNHIDALVDRLSEVPPAKRYRTEAPE